MSQENKRLAVFFVLAFGSFFAINELSIRLGLIPRNPKPRPQVVAKAEPEKGAPPKVEPAKPGAEVAAKKPDEKVKVEVVEGPKGGPVDPKDLVLGSSDPTKGYRLQVQLQQEGAGVRRLVSADYEAEHLAGRPKSTRLELIQADSKAPPSFSLSLIREPDARAAATADEDDEKIAAIAAAPTPTSEIAWEVVRDAKGRTVRPILGKDGAETGQEIVFRLDLKAPKPVTLTKTYRLRKGASENGFELELGFEGAADQKLAYQLMGPHGLPIEGEWYTGTFREVYFALVNKPVDTKTADTIVKAQADPEKYTTLPLKFAGVENQFFTVLVEPSPIPKSAKDRTDAETIAAVIHTAPEPQKSDVSFLLTSKEFEVGPNRAVTHTYKVFAGPKDAKLLAAYGAEEIASYRKGSNWFFIPGAGFLAQTVISPMLDHTYNLTYQVARFFGGKRGSYGVAIILLTMLVRLCLFPLGRKMAISAKKMQELAPLLKELQEKHKDDKERITKETFALYKVHKVNPVAGCLPAFIQMPILVGLWQALNNSPALRHAQFLWINDLSAPDMLFKMPFELPWIGPYFNLLPLAVVGLMMLQTKLFAPPATTPEAEMQQKMMKYMMIVMAVMFYKVPSGLGFYFITSSLWQIGERLILPKTTAIKVSMFKADPDGPSGDGPGRPSLPKPPAPGKAPKDNGPQNNLKPAVPAQRGWLDDLRDRVGQLMEDAQHERTTRNSPPPNRDPSRDRNRPRPKPGKRR